MNTDNTQLEDVLVDATPIVTHEELELMG